MIITKNPRDNCLMVRMEKSAHCCSCGELLRPGATAWSYLRNPADGNYVECVGCRYGDSLENFWTPWFNAGHWVHYGVPGSPSESVWMPVWNEHAGFAYARSST